MCLWFFLPLTSVQEQTTVIKHPFLVSGLVGAVLSPPVHFNERSVQEKYLFSGDSMVMEYTIPVNSNPIWPNQPEGERLGVECVESQ